jgi:hypothetical protein
MVVADDNLNVSDSQSAIEYGPSASIPDQVSFPGDFGDVLFAWNTYASTEVGIATDNVYLYTSMWQPGFGAPPWFRKYELQTGVKVDSFDIPGISTIRDMAWDGEYFYGSNLSPDIYTMNFTTHSVVDTIHTEVTGDIRHIAYDKDRDGFWCGNWNDLYFVDRTGHILQTGSGMTSAYGSEYDNTSPGGPYLWMFCQIGLNFSDLVQFRLTPMEATGVVIDAGTVPKYVSGGTAGGLCGTFINDKFVLIGDIQQDPNLIFAIEISPSSGVDELKIDIIKVYPNPVSDALTVNSTYAIDEILITNPQGQMLLFYKPENSTKTVSLDISGYRAGIYFLNVITSKRRATDRVIIF